MTLAFTVASIAEQHWGLTLSTFPLVTKSRQGYKPNNCVTQLFARLEEEAACAEFVGPAISRTKMGIMAITCSIAIEIEIEISGDTLTLKYLYLKVLPFDATP